jgi:uncharacterized SAM-binding protein YcdF (DUF218 family)
MKLRGWLRVMSLMLAGLATSWAIGFTFYLQDVHTSSMLATQAEAALPTLLANQQLKDQTAIIVLTGGSERIATGLRLLQHGYGHKLFISGAGAGTDFAKIFADSTRDNELEKCCIVLGHQADDTIGNARETALWLQHEPFHHIILVTAHYHMHRSLLEFKILTDNRAIMVYPFPVAPNRVQIADWWQRPRTALLLMTEYSKLLVTLIRYGFYSLS